MVCKGEAAKEFNFITEKSEYCTAYRRYYCVPKPNQNVTIVLSHHKTELYFNGD